MTFYKYFESKCEQLSYGLKYDRATTYHKWHQGRNTKERKWGTAQFLEEIISDHHYYKRLLVDTEDYSLSTLI